MKSVIETIQERRNIKPELFTGTEIPEGTIKTIVEAAFWAPNHGNTEPWQFFIFSGDGRKKLGEIQGLVYKESAGENFDEAKYTLLTTRPLLASHVIIPCMKRGNNAKIHKMEEIIAASCAIQNMLLTAESLGVSVYYGTGLIFNPNFNINFGLTSDDQMLGMLYLGFANEEGKQKKGKRNSSFEKNSIIITK